MSSRTISRRRFVQGAAVTGAGLALAPRLAFATGHDRSGDSLVLVVLRGGLDGMSLLVPLGDGASYHDPRGLVAVPEDRALPVDGHFGLHPAAGALHELYQDGVVAFVPAAGSPDPSRSHFDQQAVLEQGATSRPAGAPGWLARHLSLRDAIPLQAVAGTAPLPVVLHGAPSATVVPSLDGFTAQLQVTGDLAEGGATLRRLAGDGPVGATAATSTAAATTLLGVPPRPADAPAYPGGWSALRDVAHLLTSGVGLDAAVVDVGGWDLHAGMGNVDTGPMQARIAELARALGDFHAETAGLARPVTTVVVSEFGRTLAVNASGGTDHGRGGLAVVLGPGIVGGVHGVWPGLSADVLDGNAPAVATDFRDVLAEIVSVRLGTSDLAAVFPDHQPAPLGLARA